MAKIINGWIYLDDYAECPSQVWNGLGLCPVGVLVPDHLYPSASAIIAWYDAQAERHAQAAGVKVSEGRQTGPSKGLRIEWVEWAAGPAGRRLEQRQARMTRELKPKRGGPPIPPVVVDVMREPWARKPWE